MSHSREDVAPDRLDKLYLAGRWVAPRDADRLPVVNPATEAVVAEVAAAGPSEVEVAIESARRAFDTGPWPRLAPAERAAALRRVAAELRRRGDEVARAISLEMGATLRFTKAGIAGPPTIFEYYAGLVEALPGIEARERAGGRAFSVMEPIGVVAAIVPWNAPLNLSVLKLGPALAAGCTAILKPAPSTPLDALILAECFDAAGIPEGVVSVLPGGNDVGERLVRDPRIDKVTFTGSSEVGRRIGAICGERMARVALELGGKSPAIMLEDMDVEDAVARILPGSTMLCGQACSALTRVLVPSRLHDRFVEAFAAALRALRLGDPFDVATDMGPLALERQRRRVESYIALGREEGARLVTGGGRPAGLDRGWYIEPTLFAEVDNRMRIAREEIFGPVICVLRYGGEAEAVALANDSEYGLYASIFTHDEEAFWRLGPQLRVGNVAMNAVIVDRTLPYGGLRQSGIGREGGVEGLRGFQEQKTVYLG